MDLITLATVEKQKRERAADLLRQALALLEDEQAIQAVRQQKYRLGYIPKLMMILQEEGRALPIREIAPLLRTRFPELRDLRREVLERAVWMELRRKKPRIRRLGEGLYGLC